MLKQLHSAALAAACALTLSVPLTTIASPAEIDTDVYDYTRTRDDRDAGPANMAASACLAGHASIAVPDVAAGCAVAYDYAVKAGKFDDALRFAATGCEKYRNASDCRRAARVPLLMGNESTSVPKRYATEIKRLGEFVCFSGVRVTQAYVGNATGRECANLAHHFVLAQDPEYARAMEPAARAYYEAARDPALAARFYRASCKRWEYRQSCGHSRVDIAEVRQIWAATPVTSPVLSRATAFVRKNLLN